MFRSFLIVGLSALSLATACSRGDSAAAREPTRAPSPTTVTPPVQSSTRRIERPVAAAADMGPRSRIGFRSRAQFDEHFQKHGAEFGHLTQQEYLREAQALRDAQVGGSIEEIRRDDGTTSRFDRSTGAFLAFNRDGTIRTFFKPNDGEAYFRRQAARIH